jgi:hypothetical protein
MKSERTNRLIYWGFTALVAMVFMGSAVGKLFASEETLAMATGFGLDAKTYAALGVVECCCAILFVIPRTGILGTLLLSAYMGGAIASHLEHGISMAAPALVQTFLLGVAFYRFPELRSRLLNGKG